jgi:hypothetical protein
MIGITGVPTGLTPTAGVDYTIPLPYDVPALSANRVGYYFAASTLGDAYRRAVNGDANWFAWIQAAATMDDTHFALAFPPQAGLEQLRDWFRTAFVGLKTPGGSTVTAAITTTPEGAATIGAATAVPLGVPLQGDRPEGSTTRTTPTSPAPSPDVSKDVAAYQTGILQPSATGATPPILSVSPGAGMPMAKPTWLWWAVGIVAAVLLLGWLGRRS